MKTGKEIFIVDDDSIHRLLMSKLFARQGKEYKLDFFENGQKALTALESAIASPSHTIPDIILLDIEMPVMNGWEFLLAQRGDPDLAQIPVMIASAIAEQGKFSGILDFIKKPYELDELLALISKNCDKGGNPLDHA